MSFVNYNNLWDTYHPNSSLSITSPSAVAGKRNRNEPEPLTCPGTFKPVTLHCPKDCMQDRGITETGHTSPTEDRNRARSLVFLNRVQMVMKIAERSLSLHWVLVLLM